MIHVLRILFFLCVFSGPVVAQEVNFMDELLSRPAPKPDKIIPYGTNERHFGELWLPSGQTPHPVVVLVHGGCWMSKYPDAKLLHHMAGALREKGLAVWSIEYRQVGHAGAEYPGMFEDVAKGADHLKKIAASHNLNLDRVVGAGHSAGGHFALWLAGRHQLKKDSALYSDNPLELSGVVSIGGPGDLKDVVSSGLCGRETMEKLTGLSERGEEMAFSDTSPAELLPLGVTQILVHGVNDEAVPAIWGEKYKLSATQAGDRVEVITIPDAGHFTPVAPWTPAWKIVEESILSLIE